MKKRRRTIFVVTLLAALHLFVIFPGFFAPYDYSAQERELPFAPPTPLHFVDAAGDFHSRPFVYAWKERPHSRGTYDEDRMQIFKEQLFAIGSPYGTVATRTRELHLF